MTEQLWIDIINLRISNGFGTSESIADANAIVGAYEDRFHDKQPGRACDEGASEFLTLTEDVSGQGKFLAKRRNGEIVFVHNWSGIINGAKAGYEALFTNVDGQWVFDQGCTIPVDSEQKWPSPVADYRDVVASDVGKSIEVRDSDIGSWIERVYAGNISIAGRHYYLCYASGSRSTLVEWNHARVRV